jgi:hypothetical protein
MAIRKPAKSSRAKPRRVSKRGNGRLAVALEVIEVLSPIICALIVARLTRWEYK